jgi:hypothetical protein
MKWEKKGLIFKPEYDFDWMKNSAWVPCVDQIDDDRFKVYFGSRNSDNMTQTGWFIFDIREPRKVIDVSKEPILKLGPLGSFDDSLVIGCALVNHNGLKYLYYVGWMQGKRVRYYPSIGLAISSDGGKTFQKQSRAPMIERSDSDPYGMASPFVMFDEGIWRLWYASYRRWELRGDDPWSHYEIRYAESKDGINWDCKNKKCIGSEDEEAVARPYILKEDGIFKMWYCYRIRYCNYQLGYAESENGEDWELMLDKVGLELSESGPDSEMMAYPCVFEHKGKKYLLYNGNGFGVDGICLAVSKD